MLDNFTVSNISNVTVANFTMKQGSPYTIFTLGGINVTGTFSNNSYIGVLGLVPVKVTNVIIQNITVRAQFT